MDTADVGAYTEHPECAEPDLLASRARHAISMHRGCARAKATFMCALPKAAIFDLDGVLLDTEPLYTTATQAVVSEFGRNYTWELKRCIMGGTALHGATVIVSELELPISAHEYLLRRRRILERLILEARPIPGAESLVQRVSSLGIPLAIATSSERALFELKSRRHGWIRDFFCAVVCGDDPRIRNGKPAPDIFQVAATELEVRASECVIFEDSPNGVKAAAAAGARIIARRVAAIEPEELAPADIIVEDYAELRLPDAIELKQS